MDMVRKLKSTHTTLLPYLYISFAYPIGDQAALSEALAQL